MRWWRVKAALMTRYAAICPLCGLPRGWRRERAAQQSILDVGLDGEPEAYEPDGAESCACVVDEPAAPEQDTDAADPGWLP